MKKEVAQQWYDALTSGEYKQGRGCLRSRNNEFCCLGVLCNIVEPAGWVQFEGGTWDHQGMGGRLSDNMHKKTGVTDFFESDLVMLNDGILRSDGERDGAVSFEVIADLIKTNYLS